MCVHGQFPKSGHIYPNDLEGVGQKVLSLYKVYLLRKPSISKVGVARVRIASVLKIQWTVIIKNIGLE